jgi:predicted secreted protein
MAAENSKIVYGGSMMLFITSGATKMPVAFSTSAKLDLTLDIREISSKDSGIWKEKAAGKWDWNASTEGLMAFSLITGTTMDIDDLFTLMIARDPVTLSFGITSGSTPSWSLDTSKKYFGGSAIITSLSLNAPDNDNATYSITLEGASELTLT